MVESAWSCRFELREPHVPILRITVRWPHERFGPDAYWLDVTFDVAAGPFQGSVETAWFFEDLDELASAFVELDRGAGVAGAPIVVGGNRAAELRLHAEQLEAVNATADDLAVEAWLTENGDDPTPALSFDFRTTRTELREAAESLTEFLKPLRS